MRVKSAGQTDIGRRRQLNEDVFLEAPELGLFLVCDGVGGHHGGEVAAETTRQVIHDFLARNQAKLDEFKAAPEGLSLAAGLLAEAIQQACSTVYEMARQEEFAQGMATTLTALLVLGNRALLAHVGDSRLYLVRGRRAHLMTRDHTLAAELVRMGTINAAQAENHKTANVLVRAIGEKSAVQVDMLRLDLLAEDVLLICTDGLTRYLDAAELFEQIEENNLERSVERLIQLANDRGGADNITALLLRVRLGEASKPRELERRERIEGQLDLLAQTALCRGLRYRQQLRLYNSCRFWQHSAGEQLISAGDPCDRLVLLLEGELMASQGRDRERVLQPGAVLGSLSFLGGTVAGFDVSARTDVRVLTIDSAEFGQLVRRRPWLGGVLLTNICRIAGEFCEVHPTIEEAASDI